MCGGIFRLGGRSGGRKWFNFVISPLSWKSPLLWDLPLLLTFWIDPSAGDSQGWRSRVIFQIFLGKWANLTLFRKFYGKYECSGVQPPTFFSPPPPQLKCRSAKEGGIWTRRGGRTINAFLKIPSLNDPSFENAPPPPPPSWNPPRRGGFTRPLRHPWFIKHSPHSTRGDVPPSGPRGGAFSKLERVETPNNELKSPPRVEIVPHSGGGGSVEGPNFQKRIESSPPPELKSPTYYWRFTHLPPQTHTSTMPLTK